MKYVLFYESAPDVLSKAPLHMEAHAAWIDPFEERGDLLDIGVFDDPQADGAMSIFATREAAEEFVRGDPFVLNGVVASWRIVTWHSPRGQRGDGEEE